MYMHTGQMLAFIHYAKDINLDTALYSVNKY